MKANKVNLVLVIAALFIVTVPVAYSAPPPEQQKSWKWEPYGPRVDETLMPIYLSYDSQLLALKSGEVDTSYIQPARIGEVKDDPNIYVLTYQTFNLQFLGINCQQYPWNYTAIRHAVAHLIDRDWIIRNVFNGFGFPVEAPIPPAFGDWSNPNVSSYPYSKELAKKELLDAGFTYDNTTGKWYDPHGNLLGDIVIQVPPADQAPWLYQEAQRIAKDGQDIGLPLKIEAIEFQALVSQIYSKTFKSFILYLGWNRIPTLAYELFRTDGSWNFWGISDPELDAYLEKFYFTTNLTEAKQALWKAQEKVSLMLPYIPIYMGMANVGFRADIAGVVLQKPLGGQSYLTTLDVHHISLPFGGVYKTPLGSDPRTLNPFTAISGDEWDVMDNILENLFIANPDQVSSDLPWLAKSWKIEEATLNGSKITKITFYLNDNVTWQDGVKFTAKDVNFTWWFIKVNKPTQQYAMVFENLLKTEVPDDYTIVAYVNGTSWTYFYDLNVVIVPEHIWGNSTLLATYGGWDKWDPSKVSNPIKSNLTCLVGTGPFIFRDRKPGEYISLKWYPNYWRRNPAKSLAIELNLIKTIYSGQPLSVEVRVNDYTGTPSTNATVVVRLISNSGGITKSVVATHQGNGIYKATLDTSDITGDYTVSVLATATISEVSVEKEVTSLITVKPAWEQYLPYIVLIAIVIIVAAVIVIYLRRKKATAPKSEVGTT